MENTPIQSSTAQFISENQPAVSHSSNTAKILIIGLFILLPIVGVGGYYLGSKGSTKLESDPPVTPAPMVGDLVGGLPQGWFQEGQVTRTQEECYSVETVNIGSQENLEKYLNTTYKGVEQDTQTKYFGNSVKTITLPSLGIGEVKTVFVQPDKDVYKISVNYIGPGEVNTNSESEMCEQRKYEIDWVIRMQPITAEVAQSAPAARSRCRAGFTFTETEAFSLCLPTTYSLDSYDKTEEFGVLASYKKGSSKTTLGIYEQFVGGWGGNPCLKTSSVSFLGKTAQQVTDRENLSNSLPGDVNAQCGQPFEVLVSFPNRDKWAIGLNGGGEAIDLEEFNVVKDSFSVK